MPEFNTLVPRDVALERIVRFASDPREERLPASLRDKRLVRLTLYDHTAHGFTLHFGLTGRSRASRYVDGRVEQRANGSLIRFTIRAALTPRIAVTLILMLAVLQDIYELIRGTFSSFNAGFTVIAPIAAGLLALLEKRSIARNFDVGMTDALRQAVLEPVQE